MVIKLQDIKSTFDGFSRLAQLANDAKHCAFEKIEIDMSLMNWFDAHMSAPLGVIFSKLTDRLNTVHPVAIAPNVELILKKNLFLVNDEPDKLSDTYGTVIPFRRFNPDDDRYFVSYLNKHLKGKGIPKMSEGLGRRFKESLLEIFVNSAMHSETTLGVFGCGQFFPAQQRLDFCVADAGIGIRRKIKNELNLSMNSDKAILWAIEEGHTTRTGSVPGGLGLKLLREFIALNKGRIQIVSDRGYWECDGGNTMAKRMEYSFPGTVVNLEINTADAQSYCLSSETIN